MTTRFSGLQIGPGAGITAFPGVPHHGLLRIAANVAAEETVVIGADTYRFAVVNTDATKNTTRAMVVELETHEFYMSAHGLIVGDLIRVENEIMLVTHVLDANRIALKRGVSGTTIATHDADSDIFTEATPGEGGIAVGLVTTLTPTAASAALIADINNRGSTPVRAVQHTANGVFVVNAVTRGGANHPGLGVAYATTETMAGANNAWATATLAGGEDPYIEQTVVKVPSATEVALALMRIPFPFTPEVVAARWITTADGTVALVDGTVTVVGNDVTIDQAGGTDFAATHTLFLTVRGR